MKVLLLLVPDVGPVAANLFNSAFLKETSRPIRPSKITIM